MFHQSSERWICFFQQLLQLRGEFFDESVEFDQHDGKCSFGEKAESDGRRAMVWNSGANDECPMAWIKSMRNRKPGRSDSDFLRMEKLRDVLPLPSKAIADLGSC